MGSMELRQVYIPDVIPCFCSLKSRCGMHNGYIYPIVHTGTNSLGTLTQAKTDIVAVFHLTGRRIFTYPEIARIFAQNRQQWRVSTLTPIHSFLEFLVESKIITIEEIIFPSRTYVKYTRGQIPIHALLLSIHRDSYFTHHTAMYLHKLTEQEPRRIYLNIEQREKFSNDPADLLQENIDKAFKHPPRITKNTATYKTYQIYLLNGMYTGQLGVEEMLFPRAQTYRCTSLERTLIDMAVRPFYSGGVSEVLEGYAAARRKLSVTKLIRLLRQLNYVYPYHQAIGFYMERADYDNAVLETIRKNFPIKYDFYLCHEMRKTTYSKAWRLYFPEKL
jgi:predicted transcriptional regulator of viral defense system